MTQLLQLLLGLCALAGIAITIVLFGDNSTTRIDQSMLTKSENQAMALAKAHPDKFASFDMSTLDCRPMDMKGAVMLFIPVLCYVKNDKGVETDITHMLKQLPRPAGYYSI